MNLFGVGSLEVLVILLIGFLILGPTRLLGLAKGMGKMMGELRKVTSQIERMGEEIDKAAQDDDPPEDRT